jgi:hypothetical protein
MATIKVPYGYEPREYQLPLLKAMDSGIKRAIITWNRRSGKDKTCFNYMIKRAVEKVGTYFYLLPTYSQAKKVIWENIDNNGFKMLDHIPRELIKSTNSTELKVELINGSIVQLIAADEFKKSGVGTNPVGVVFSEYSISDPEAWKYLSPILAVNGGWAIFNFTPRGMNHAWNLLQFAKDNEKWFTQILTIDDTKVMTKEQFEEEKAQYPADFVEQEYYCKFIEGAGQFFRRIDNNIHRDDLVEKPDYTHRYKMGVDLGKYQDYTVITLIDLMNMKVLKQDRFNQIDWNLQKSRIEVAYLKYFKPEITMDSTGLGDPIYDDLSKKGLNIVPFKFTEASRMDILNNLLLLLEQDRIKIPDDPILKAELQSFRYTMTETRKIKVGVPEGLHDDCVFSLALACYNLPNKPLPIYGIRRLNQLPGNDQTSYE